MDQVSIAQTLVPTENYQPIRAGGHSSSETLNRLFWAVGSDIHTLRQEVQRLVDAQERAFTVYSGQASALSQMVSAVRAALSLSGSALVDFFSSDYLQSYTPNSIDFLYGQATAPVQSARSLLKYRDSGNDLWVLDGTSIGVARNSGAVPSDGDYLPEDDIRYALDDRMDTAWMVPVNGYNSVWVMLDTVLLFATTRANALCFIPYPAFGVNVARVSVQADGVWSDLDLSYAAGYQPAQGIVQAGPTRLFFDEKMVSRVRFHLKPQMGVTHVGFLLLDVQRVEFGDRSTVRARIPNISQISSVAVYGKDPATLQQLVTTSANEITLSLTATSAASSPVVTAIGVTFPS